MKFRLYVHVPLMGNRSLDNKKLLLQQKVIRQVVNNHILRLKFFMFRLYLKGEWGRLVILLAPSPAPKVQLFGLFFRFSRSYGCSPLFVQHERKSAAVRFYSLYMRLEFLSFSKRFFVFCKEESSHLDGRNRRKKTERLHF